MVDKDLLVVDKETKDAIVDELWNDILSSQNLTSQQSPQGLHTWRSTWRRKININR